MQLQINVYVSIDNRN